MVPWKPFLAVVPAGLLLGLVAGQATRPVMLVKDDRPWPLSGDEMAREADRWPRLDLAGPNIASRGYSYRPDIDYDLFVWPDQRDRSTELLAADYDYGGAATGLSSGDGLPLTRRAVAELAGRQAERLAAEAVSEGAATDPAVNTSRVAPDVAEGVRGVFVLPPVPPPLARAGTLPELTELEEDETY